VVYRNYTTMQNAVISRNSNFVPQKIVYFNPDGEQESDVKVFGHNVKVYRHNVKVFRHHVKVLGHNVKVIGLYAKVLGHAVNVFGVM